MLAAQQEQGLLMQQASRVGTLSVPARHNGSGQQSGGVEEVEEMRERVRELEHQLAERERLIESLDILR